MKYPPATDATPEELVRAVVRHGPSSDGRESGRTKPDAGRSIGEEPATPEIPSERSGSLSGEPLSPNDRERHLERILEPLMPPEMRREFLQSLRDLDSEENR